MAVKKYSLKIIYNVNTGEITHLSESFSDVNKVNLEVYGEVIEIPLEMQEMIEEMCEDILGVC